MYEISIKVRFMDISYVKDSKHDASVIYLPFQVENARY